MINNGLDLKSFSIKDSNNNNNTESKYTNKIKNKFIYSSRPDRGLNVLLKLWPNILEKFPDATLVVSSYGNFPSNSDEIILKNIIDINDSIKFLGKLSTDQLYVEMASSEYWLYPTHWPETSCITALEMLMSEVICLYYPVAGLVNTMDKYGIQVQPGKEIDTIVSLTDVKKETLRKNGREYAETCSWSNRCELWNKLLSLNQIINKKENVLENVLEKDTDFKNTYLYTAKYILEVVQDYRLGLKEKYNIETSNNLNFIINSNAEKIIFIGSINKDEYDTIKSQLPNCKICLLNLEPLNLSTRIKVIINNYSTYKIKIYDYSLTNLKILKSNSIDNIELLPYICTNNETLYLKNLYETTEKIYDFGILSGCGAPNNSINELGPKRRKLVEYLISIGFKVNIIKAWKEERDKELAKCNIILNIHGQLFENGYWLDSNIFEHLRCDRLLNSGFKILSEESYCLDIEFIQTYPNLNIIDYCDFFKPKIYNQLGLK